MKKIFTILSVFALMFVMTGLTRASVTISFVDPLEGIDDITGWDIDNNVNHLNHSYLLLGGTAEVSAWTNDQQDDLSHRINRGLGVWDYCSFFSEPDEIDLGWRDGEGIRITFDTPHYINYIEVRSLFSPDTDNNTEYAAIDFIYGGSAFATTILAGNEPLSGGNDGNASMSYASPYLVDELVFYVPTVTDTGSCYCYCKSEFAVAKLEVTPIPATGAVILSSIGVALVGWLRRRKML